MISPYSNHDLLAQKFHSVGHNYFREVVTLYFLVVVSIYNLNFFKAQKCIKILHFQNKIITVAEADLFLCTFYNSHNKNFPSSVIQEELIFSKEAFQLPFVFEKLFKDVCSAIHISGLPNKVVSLSSQFYFFLLCILFEIERQIY